MNRIWLSSYPKDVPLDIDPEKYSSLITLFEESIKRFADRPAYCNMGHTLSYKELDEKSLALAVYIQQELNLSVGDRIAIMMPNLLQYPVALMAILRAGMIVVNVNPLYTPRELEYQLNDSGAKAIIIASNFMHTLEQVINQTDIKKVIITDIPDLLPPVKRIFYHTVIKYIKKLIPQRSSLSQSCYFRDALKKGANKTFHRPNIAIEDIAFLQYTGGTTGVSKAVMLTHRNIIASVEQSHAAFSSVLNSKNEVIITALPLYHVFALTLNCFLMIKIGSCSLLITNPRDINHMIKIISRHVFTAFTGVNTLFNAMLQNEKFKKLDFSRLHITVGGGMPVNRSVAEQWHKITGGHILEGYGLTECSPIVAANPYTQTEYNGSIGLPFPSTDIRLVNDMMQDVAMGEMGELLVAGPQVMKGYWNRPEATQEVMYNGWLRTGDMAKIDEQGYLYIVDRKKDMILVSGFNVYPIEVENILLLNTKIADAAVIGLTQNEGGECVIAYIVKTDPTLTENDVIHYCRQYLTAYKVPKRIIFLTKIPKSAVGKTLKEELKAQANERK